MSLYPLIENQNSDVSAAFNQEVASRRNKRLALGATAAAGAGGAVVLGASASHAQTADPAAAITGMLTSLDVIVGGTLALMITVLTVRTGFKIYNRMSVKG